MQDSAATVTNIKKKGNKLVATNPLAPVPLCGCTNEPCVYRTFSRMKCTLPPGRCLYQVSPGVPR